MPNKILKIILVLDLVAVNGMTGYLLWRSITPELRSTPLNLRGETEVINKDDCGEECKDEIKNQLASLQVKTQRGETIVVLPSATPTSKPVVKTTVKKVRREEILAIPGSGSVLATDWTDISGTFFYFDIRDWPGLVEIFFEANMKLFNSNGYGYVRLFDVTHGIAVTGSENNTNSQADIWTKSQKVYFWAGKNLIKVQAKSLTSDTTVYNLGRLRRVMEN